MSNKVKYPYITIDLAEVTGENALTIIGKVSAILKENGSDKCEIDALYAQATSGNYENVLNVCRQYINII